MHEKCVGSRIASMDALHTAYGIQSMWSVWFVFGFWYRKCIFGVFIYSHQCVKCSIEYRACGWPYRVYDIISCATLLCTRCVHCFSCLAPPSVCLCVSFGSIIYQRFSAMEILPAHVKINSIVLSSKDLLLKALINGNNERERKEINRSVRAHNMHCIWNNCAIRNMQQKCDKQN